MDGVHWKDSSTWRFFCYLLVGLLIIAFLTSVGYFIVVSHSEHQHFDHSIKMIYNTHVPKLVEKLWITDYPGVEEIAKGIVRFNSVSRVEIRNDSKVVAKAGIPPRPEMEVISKQLNYKYKDKTVPIGSVSLFIDKQKLFISPLKSAVWVASIQILLSLCLAALVAAAYYISFGRRLTKFILYLQSDDLTPFQSPLVFKGKKSRRDEIQLLSDEYNVLRKKIDDYLLKLNETNEKLSETNKQLLDERQNLQWNKEQLELALNVAVIGVWDWNFKSNELNFGAGYYTMLGYEPDEFSASFENWKRLIHPADLKDALQTAEKYLKAKPDFYENFFRMKTKSGDYRWIYAQGRVVEHGQNGEAVRMIGNHMDITDRELLHKQLKDIERRNQALLDHSPVCHKIVDLDFNLQYMSANGFKMLKLEPDAEVYGKPYPFEFFPETFKREMTDNLEYVKKTGETVTMEALTNDVKGNDVWLDSSLIPVLDDDGRIDYITVVSANTTQRKLDEEDRKRLREKLAQSQKMETIGTLAGGIAHDFNNILYPIIGFSEMLIEDLAEGGLEYESARDILKAGERGADLVKQILSFSRQTEHKMMPVKIQHVLKEVLKLSRSTIPSYIEIHQDIQEDCGLIMADFTQIHQIAMNIITNAYHAVETDGGEISVVLRETKIEDDSPGINLEPGEYAILSISDTGNGVPPENIDKIFDPYFTTKKKGKGTGLGLAVVYGIVREHKGDINVYSEIGKGATFNIYLPLIRKMGESDVKDATENLPTGNERILLVDDDPSVEKLERLMLERLGYTVTGCINSMEALEVFRENPNAFDLIVSDMNMPGIPGDHLAGDIKSIRTDIPIIICTGYSDRISNDEIGGLGIEGILMKPVVKSEMAKMVRKVIEGD